MANPQLGGLLKAQVERSKQNRAVVVQFAATIPGDGSPVSVDWWLRQINTALSSASIPFSMEFADLDHPAQIVSDGESSAIKVTQLKRQLAEAQAYIQDLENNLREKATQLAEEMMGNRADGNREDNALRAVELDGFYIDQHKQKWVDIATEAQRLGRSYITVWRAAKGIGIHKIAAWVVGETQAGGERILVKQGSFAAGKRRKKAVKA